MEIVGELLRIFPFNPFAALLLAILFGMAARNRARPAGERSVLRFSALLWGLYAPWELYMFSWRSPTGDMAIRVDLVLLVPVMLIVLMRGMSALLGRRRNTSPSRGE